MHCMCIQKEIEKIGTFGINLLFHFYVHCKNWFQDCDWNKGGQRVSCFRFVFYREPPKSAVNPRFKTTQEDAFEIGQDIDTLL